MADFRYKSLKPWKIDNIDLTQQFSLSIFTDFRYQSIKITWLLSIFIDWLLRVFRDCPGQIGHFAWEDFFFYASSTVVQGDCYLLV